MSKKNNPRKQRTIKNALITVDDIQIEAGYNFCNWIPPIRIKLKEREMISLQKRIDSTRGIITSSLNQFYQQNMQYFRDDKTVRIERMDSDNFLMYDEYIDSLQITQIMEQCEISIINELANWNGVKIPPKNKKDITIRQYFSKCRNWWDQKKNDILSTYFWNVIINLIDTFTKEAAVRFFSNRFMEIQYKYHQYLYLLILYNLLIAMIKVPNTANKYLISARICSKFIDQNVSFIQNLDINNDGNILRKIQNVTKRNRCNDIRDIIVESIRCNYDFYKLCFQETLSNLHNEFKYYGTNNNSQITISSPTAPIIIHQNIQQQTIYNNNNNNSERMNNDQISIPSSIEQPIYPQIVPDFAASANCNDYVAFRNESDGNHNSQITISSPRAPIICHKNIEQQITTYHHPPERMNNDQISILPSIEQPIYPYIVPDFAVCANCNGYVPFRNESDGNNPYNVQNTRYRPY